MSDATIELTVARRRESVVPACPFVARRLADHPVAALVVEKPEGGCCRLDRAPSA